MLVGQLDLDGLPRHAPAVSHRVTNTSSIARLPLTAAASEICKHRASMPGDNLSLMVAALELYFDPVAERRIRRLWDALEDAGVQTLRDLTHGRHRPHLSLTSAERLDAPAVQAALDGFTVAPPLTLKLDFIGQFLGRVLWLGPVPDAALLKHHAAVHKRLVSSNVDSYDVYRPGAWVPHCTLSMRVPLTKLTDAIRLCLDVLPIEATIAGAAIADYARDEYTPLTTH